MMLVQILLILGLVFLMIRFLMNPKSHQIKAWKKIFGILLIFLALAAIILPDALTSIANLIGVGRGADLLLYALALAFMFTSFNGYITAKREQERIVELARKMAIIEANERYRTTPR